MTTRRWMAVVAGTALLIAGSDQARKWVELVASSREEGRYCRLYDEGRVTALRYVESSERVMHARVALSHTKAGQRTAEAEHLALACTVLRREQDELIGSGGCFGNSVADVAEVRHYIDALRERMVRPPRPRGATP